MNTCKVARVGGWVRLNGARGAEWRTRPGGQPVWRERRREGESTARVDRPARHAEEPPALGVGT